MEAMEGMAARLKFHDGIDEIEPFIFGYELDGGKPRLGDGTDDHPHFFGVTTSFMLKPLRSVNTHVLHIVATYKLKTSLDTLLL